MSPVAHKSSSTNHGWNIQAPLNNDRWLSSGHGAAQQMPARSDARAPGPGPCSVAEVLKKTPWRYGVHKLDVHARYTNVPACVLRARPRMSVSTGWKIGAGIGLFLWLLVGAIAPRYLQSRGGGSVSDNPSKKVSSRHPPLG